MSEEQDHVNRSLMKKLRTSTGSATIPVRWWDVYAIQALRDHYATLSLWPAV